GIVDALQLVGKPVLALDWQGTVLRTNGAADALFDDDFYLASRALVVTDAAAGRKLSALIDRLRSASDKLPLSFDPIVVARRRKRPLVLQVLPVPVAARTPFVGARALVMISDVDRSKELPSEVLSHTFKLSPAESGIARLIGLGESIEHTAEMLGISPHTV